MKIGFITDNELKTKFGSDDVEMSRSILNLQDKLLQIKNRDGKIDLIKKFLSEVPLSKRDLAVSLMDTAKYGRNLVQEAFELLKKQEDEELEKNAAIKIPTFDIDLPSNYFDQSISMDSSEKIEPETSVQKQQTQAESTSRSLTNYIIPVVIGSGGLILGVILVYNFLK